MSKSYVGCHELGDFELMNGQVLRQAWLKYRVWGEPNAERDNFVILPGYYTGNHDSYAPLVGGDSALDPERFCIVALDVFGMGESTSPSNAVGIQAGPGFPPIDMGDSVRAQYATLRERFGMRSAALVAGWSIGGIQAYFWASGWPTTVRRLLPWCASARCSPHNYVFLEGAKSALEADCEFASGHYKVPPQRGLRAFARVYCGWAYSQAFFRRHGWHDLGYTSLEDMLVSWEREHVEEHDANDLLAVLNSWERSDIGVWLQKDWQDALASIEARTVLMPCRTDLYFPPAENYIEAAVMKNAEVEPIDSDQGHAAGGPGRDPVFRESLERSIETLLSDYYDGEVDT